MFHHKWPYYLGILIGLLLPGSVYAATPLNLFRVDPNDLSLEYLSMIFGNVGDVLTHPNGGNQMLGSLFLQFNTGIFAIGVLFLTYTSFTAIIKTAYEGQFMGKQSSLFLAPVKATIGLLLMLPTQSGYSFLQVFFMWVILNSIGAANQMWTQVYQYLAFENQMTQQDNLAIQETVSKLVDMAACAEAHNQNVSDPDDLFTISVYPEALALRVGNTRTPSACGTITIPRDQLQIGGQTLSASAQEQLAALFLEIYQNAIEYAYGLGYHTLTYYANPNNRTSDTLERMPSGQDMRYMGIYNDLKIVVTQSIEQGVLNAAEQMRRSSNLGSSDAAALNNFFNQLNYQPSSWLKAGSYYVGLTRAQRDTERLNSIRPNVSVPRTQVTLQNQTFDRYTATQHFYNWFQRLKEKTDPENRGIYTAGIRGGENVAGVPLISSAFTSAFQSLAVSLTQHDQDPLLSLAMVGNYILQVIEFSFYATIIAILATAILASCELYNPFATALRAALNAWIVLFSIASVVLWTGASLLAFYLPMIPYLVFLFAAISWFITVIEAMVAAPLVAAAFLAPSRDELGKSAIAMGLLTNVFFRPTLMVVGFAAGAHVMYAIVDLLNYAFSDALSGLVGDVGFFAWIGFLILYVSIMSTIVNECFSLIYVIPDKILRMMGGQAEMSSVSQSLQKAKQAHDKGTENSKGALQGANKFAGMMNEKVNQGGGGGGGGQGGGGGEGAGAASGGGKDG